MTRKSTTFEGTTVIYVRVPPKDKRLLRDLSDREFDGSMAAALRHLIDFYIDANPLPSRKKTSGKRLKVSRNGDIDED